MRAGSVRTGPPVVVLDEYGGGLKPGKVARGWAGARCGRGAAGTGRAGRPLCAGVVAAAPAAYAVATGRTEPKETLASVAQPSSQARQRRVKTARQPPSRK